MEKIWLKSYPKGMPTTIADDKQTLNDLFENVCKIISKCVKYI